MGHSPRLKTSRRYVVSHGFAQLMFWSSFYYLFPALSALIVSETDWPVVHISNTYTFAFLVWALCTPIVGILIDKGYGATVIRSGAMMGVVLLLLLSQIADKWMFSILVTLLGVCMAATLYDPCFALMMKRQEKTESNAVATVTLIAGFATLLTFPIVFALSSGFTWHQIVLVFAAFAAIGAILLPDDRQTEPTIGHWSPKLPLEKGPILIAISFGLVMLGHSVLVFLLPLALVRIESEANVALLALAILGPAQIAGRIAWRAFSPAVTVQNGALIMFAVLCVPASLLLIFGTASLVIYAALIVQGACYGVHTILRPNLAQLYLPSMHLGRGLGMIAMVGVLMMAVGPAFGGVVWTFAGMTGLMGVVLFLNISALLLGIALRATQAKDVVT